MRKALLIVGSLLVALSLAVAYLVYEGVALDSEGVAFVDAALPAIATHWNPTELTDRASVSLQKAASDQKIRELFGYLDRRLGSLQDFGDPKGSTFTTLMIGSGLRITGHYVVTARFARGSADIDFALVKLGGKWRIAGFHVNPTALAPRSGYQPI